MYPTRKQVIDSLLPERSIGIISGSSGAGKTILTMQCVEEWLTRSTFLGYTAKPNPVIAYFTYDRSEEDAYDTLNSLGIYLPQMKIYCGITGTDAPLPDQSVFKQSDCVIIDGLDCLVRNANEFHEVRITFHKMMILLESTSCVLWGITGSSKAKAGEGYLNSRDRSFGSSAWSRLSGTNINIVLDEDALVNTRIVHVTPRTGPKLRLEMDFNEKGRLVLSKDCGDDSRITNFLKHLPPDFSTAVAHEIGVGLEYSPATVTRYLNRLLADGRLSKIEHGRYKKMPLN